MQFLELAKKRYSVRRYTTRPLEAEKISMVLEAGRIAPTGANAQPQRLILAQESETLQKISSAANIFGAPCAIIVCCDRDKTWTRPFDGKKLTDIDATIVTDHMMLQATELGLGTLWICYFKSDVIKEQFHLPTNWEPVNILALGYSDETPQSPERHEKTRKPLSETLWREKIR